MDYREVYEILSQDDKNIVDSIYNAVNNLCKDKGYNLAYDDRAENFAGAITKYLIESGVIKLA